MFDNDTLACQFETCAAVGAASYPVDHWATVGISQSALDNEFPINGLRHPDKDGVSGWFIWGGVQFSAADDFFIRCMWPISNGVADWR